MLVSCPSCSTAYRVSDNLITTLNPTFRCSRCKHTFVLELKFETNSKKAKAPPPPESPQEDEEKSAELSFSFPSTQTDTTEKIVEEDPRSVETTKPPLPDIQDQQPPTDGQDQQSTEPPIPPSEESSAQEEALAETPSTHEQDPSQPFIPPSPTDWNADFEAKKEEENFPFQEEETRAETADDPRQAIGLSVIPFISLFGLLLLIFFMTTLTYQYQAKPTQLESLIKVIPWFGPLIIKNNHLRKGIVVSSLRSDFQTIFGGHRVFVISGKIINRTSVSVGEIQVEGQIYSAEGEKIKSQAISVGNAISTKIIQDMTAREISILQRLKPQKRFEIPPEESAAFTIVFLKPTEKIKSFSCRVLSAKETI
ncbi:MAG: zinc-ribbon domain-containing protein [Deltaproteobacteria bacterium]|nr:zinc-ribbon domain-containing protein [Deltaproteobacteria bacterium]